MSFRILFLLGLTVLVSNPTCAADTVRKMRVNDCLTYSAVITNSHPTWDKKRQLFAKQTVLIKADSRTPKYGSKAFTTVESMKLTGMAGMAKGTTLASLLKSLPSESSSYYEQSDDGTVFARGAVYRYASSDKKPIWYPSPIRVGQKFSYKCSLNYKGLPIQMNYNIQVTGCEFIKGRKTYIIHRLVNQVGKPTVNIVDWFCPALGYAVRNSVSLTQGEVSTSITIELVSADI